MTSTLAVLREVKRVIREPYAFPGGYAVRLMMHDSEVLCATCTRDNFKAIVRSTLADDRDGWQASGAFVHWEGQPIACAHCDCDMPSEYGDPWAEIEE